MSAIFLDPDLLEKVNVLKDRASVFLETNEHEHAERLLSEWARLNSKRLYIWTNVHGISDPDGAYIPNTKDFIHAIDYALTINDPNGLIFFYNGGKDIAQSTLAGDVSLASPMYWLLRRNVYNPTLFPVVLSGNRYVVPDEIDPFLERIEVPLPDAEELADILDGRIASFKLDDASIDPETKRRIVNASTGLTRIEAGLSYNEIIQGKALRADAAKQIARKKTSKYQNKALEYQDSELNLNDIGGLENLKQWLVKRKPLWLADEKVTRIPKPKGILLTGLPGTGKSLTAKATAQIFGFPLLRLDMGSVFGRYYGESEEGMRTAIKAAEANAPCVLWIDEIEKGLGNDSEGGAQTRETVLGTLLTWMQEKTSAVFLVATANNIQNLRPEFLRKGRFDEIFFVDLPNEEERESIFKVHLKKRLPKEKVDIAQLVRQSDGYTGAEIEQAILTAMINVYGSGKEATTDDIVVALLATVPISVLQRTSIEATRQWAQETKAVRASTTPGAKAVGDGLPPTA